MSKVAEGRARLAAPLTPERRQFIEDNAVSLLRERDEKIVRLQHEVVTLGRKARWAERRLADLSATTTLLDNLQPSPARTRWTAEERLRLVAIMLARKRAEAMGRIPSTATNNESMLAVASAPPHVLDVLGPALDELIVDAQRDGVSGGHAELWAAVEADIRSMFAREHWPRWLAP